MYERQGKNLIFNNISNASEDILVEEHVANVFIGEFLHLFVRERRVPSGRHNVRRIVVGRFQVCMFDDLNRAIVHADLSVLERKHEPWDSGFFVISGYRFPLDHCTKSTVQKEMNLQGEAVKLKKKVFTPAENIFDDVSLKAMFFDQGVARCAENNLFPKRSELLFCEK